MPRMAAPAVLPEHPSAIGPFRLVVGLRGPAHRLFLPFARSARTLRMTDPITIRQVATVFRDSHPARASQLCRDSCPILAIAVQWLAARGLRGKLERDEGRWRTRVETERPTNRARQSSRIVGASAGRRMVTAALLVAMMVTAVEQLVVSPAMPTIIAKLKGFEIYPWVISAYLLAATVSTPIYGKLADLFGRKRVLLFGLALFTLGSVLSGTSMSMGQLIAMRTIQGLGAGAVGPIVLTMLGDVFTLQGAGPGSGALQRGLGPIEHRRAADRRIPDRLHRLAVRLLDVRAVLDRGDHVVDLSTFRSRRSSARSRRSTGPGRLS